MQKLDENLWIVQAALHPLKTLTTMTVIRIPGRRLIVLSPIAPSQEILKNIKDLGEVIAVISPNYFHHLYFHKFLTHFPEAHYYFSPALANKIKNRLNASRHTALEENLREPWTEEITPILIRGMPMIQEFVFYHHSTKTLIGCDFLFLVKKPSSFFSSIFWRALGIVPETPSQSRFFRFHIKDKPAYRKTLQTLENFAINRIIVAHEQVIEGDNLKQAKILMSLAGKEKQKINTP